MNLDKVLGMIKAEESTHQEAMDAVLQQAYARRQKLAEQIVAEINLPEEVSDSDFCAILKAFDGTAIDLATAVSKVGFGKEVFAEWLSGARLPDMEARRPLLNALLTVAFNAYCGSKLQYGAISLGSPSLPLDQKLSDSPFWNACDTRIHNILNNTDIVVLGELLAMSEQEFRRIPNCGRHTVNILKGLISMYWGVSPGSLPQSERDKYKEMQNTRYELFSAAESMLQTEWLSDEKEKRYADADLIAALKQAGITQRTELATAPLEVVERICANNVAWKEQLPFLMLSEYKHRSALRLGMSIPPHLHARVRVYKSIGS